MIYHTVIFKQWLRFYCANHRPVFIIRSMTAAHAVIWLLIQALMIFRNHAKLLVHLFICLFVYFQTKKSAQICNVGMVTIFPY